ncbi:NADase-type glycan-binding domain-containing protein [Reichenbachiella versicolor]|uniref:NADase-type glycan-binding domain-containing protein n=1 Tax=Reichenbachiella versicolor TaxID=1821036 RepID=UPI000D6DE043|nr:hypothetical protein [Reichenbachiella versicolor]
MKNLIPFLLVTILHITATAQIVQLEGLYATSTALPLEENAVDNLFDDDIEEPVTYWRTMKGAGPNEGIMMYFSEPTYIGSLEIDEEVGAEYATKIIYEVYGDGRSFGSTIRDMGVSKNIDQELTSLYIKIADCEEVKSIEQVIGDKTHHRSIFDADKSVSISEIYMYGKDDSRYKILPPKTVKGKIESSSSLTPALAYGATNLMDSKKEFGWAEGSNGNGINQKLTFTTDEEITISAIKIWNGYQRSPSHYKSNTRLKSFEFGLGDGTGATHMIKDEMSSQIVKLNAPITGRKFTLTVKDIFPGSKYQDLVISELKFLDGDQHIIISTDAEEKRIRNTQANSNAILDRYIDRNISVYATAEKHKETEGGYFYEDFWKQNSLILRSNNTFVMYESEEYSVGEYREKDDYENSNYESKEIIADGNWELKESGDDYVKVRIFGKIFTPTTRAELYHGDVTSANVRIFQDKLTLTKQKVSGERFVEDIVVIGN